MPNLMHRSTVTSHRSVFARVARGATSDPTVISVARSRFQRGLQLRAPFRSLRAILTTVGGLFHDYSSPLKTRTKRSLRANAS